MCCWVGIEVSGWSVLTLRVLDAEQPLFPEPNIVLLRALFKHLRCQYRSRPVFKYLAELRNCQKRIFYQSGNTWIHDHDKTTGKDLSLQQRLRLTGWRR